MRCALRPYSLPWHIASNTYGQPCVREAYNLKAHNTFCTQLAMHTQGYDATWQVAKGRARHKLARLARSQAPRSYTCVPSLPPMPARQPNPHAIFKPFSLFWKFLLGVWIFFLDKRDLLKIKYNYFKIRKVRRGFSKTRDWATSLWETK